MQVDLLSTFKDRDVAIAFAASTKGTENAMQLADALYPIVKSVHVVKWPDEMGMPDTKGEKLYDYFVKHCGTVDSLNDLMVQFKSNEPLPLMRELQPAREYPVDALPPIIRDAVLDVSNAMQCPPALPAHSFLAVSALSVQTHMDVEIDGRKSPASCFFVTIAESGERKTAIDKYAMAPVIKQEEKLRDEQKEKIVEYNIKMAVRKKSEKMALNADNPVQALEALGPVPVRPLDASFTVEEPTYEGLVKKLENGQPSVGLFSSEGGRFLGGHAMNRDNQQKSAAGLSSLWDGSPVTRTRVNDSITMYGKRVSLHLMIQPYIAEQLLGSDLLIAQGLMSRILIAYPESNIGKRKYKSVDLNKSAALKKFNQVIGKILSLPLPIKPGTINELEPEIIGLTDEAMERWVVFHDSVEADMQDGRQFSAFVVLLPKLQNML